jgi:hypothetical protein
MNSGQWDNTYGGGFWWNTIKESKPTQTNGLALQLFLSALPNHRANLLQGLGYICKKLACRLICWILPPGLYIWKIDGAGSAVLNTPKNSLMITL